MPYSDLIDQEQRFFTLLVLKRQWAWQPKDRFGIFVFVFFTVRRRLEVSSTSRIVSSLLIVETQRSIAPLGEGVRIAEKKKIFSKNQVSDATYKTYASYVSMDIFYQYQFSLTVLVPKWRRFPLIRPLFNGNPQGMSSVCYAYFSPSEFRIGWLHDLYPAWVPYSYSGSTIHTQSDDRNAWEGIISLNRLEGKGFNHYPIELCYCRQRFRNLKDSFFLSLKEDLSPANARSTPWKATARLE